MSSPLIRLLLVDNHRSSREPLAMLLNSQPDLMVVEQVGSAAEARKLIDAGVPVDIAIVEIDLGESGGTEVIREFCKHNPDAEVLVLTGNTNPRIHGCAIHAGASGIISKTATPTEVIAAVRKLAAGESLIPPAEAAALLARGEQYQHEDEDVRTALAQLTPREREVLRGLVAGMSNEAIAHQLCIGSETVRSHVVRILHKLDASSRLQAAILVIRHGFTDDQDTK